MSSLPERMVIREPSTLARLRRPLDDAAMRVPSWLPWRLLLWAMAFLTAFEGQVLLDERRLGRAVVYMAVATVFIVVSTLGQRFDDLEEIPAAETGESLLARLRGFIAPIALLIVAIGLGIAFRVHRLGSEPAGIWFDEAQNGLIARAILDGDNPRLFIGGFTQLPSLFFYLYAAAFRIGGESILTLRSFTALGGLLALPLVFLLGRELFGWRVGAIAIFLLAIMRWHVNFSRFGVTNIWATMFALGAAYFLVRGLRGKGWWNLVIAGIFTGLGPYAGFYFALFPGVLVVFWLHSAFSKRVLSWRDHILAMAAVGLVALAVYSPVAYWAREHWDEFTDRPSSASILKDKTRDEQIKAVLKSTKQHVLMFNVQGDGNGRHNLAGAPMVDPFTGIFFVLGIGISVSRIRRPEYFLLLAWLAIMMQSGIWSVEFEAPQSFRTSTLTPAVALLAALPLGALWVNAEEIVARAGGASAGAAVRWRGALARSGVAARYGLGAAVVLALLFFLSQAAYSNYDRYFNEQLRDSASWQSYSTDVTIVANEIHRLESEAEPRLSTLFVGQPTLYFVNDGLDDRPLYFDWVLDLPATSDLGAAYFFDATKAPLAAWLLELYPDAILRTFTPPGVADPIVVYEVIAGSDDVQALRGLEAVYTPADGDATSVREAALDLDWSADAPGAFPIEAVWSGYIEAETYDSYQITLDVPGSARLFLDDELIAEGSDQITASMQLFKGEHKLLVEATVEDPGLIRLSWNGAPIDPKAYFSYALAGHGLMATFYQSEDLSGEPVLVELDPLVAFRFHGEPQALGRPFSIAWRGVLDVPSSGTYIFELEAFDRGTVSLDGRLQISTDGGTTVQEVELTEGLHEIEVTFVNVSGFANVALYWTAPDGVREVIPPQRFRPR